MTKAEDMFYMERALSLAEKGAGRVNPNPLVGAVVVRDGSIIGEGWHERFGGLHAERNALAACHEGAEGGTLYVTLEPCCHHGKTPPCTEAILAHKISRVVIGSPDPNPLVSGEGVRILREAGIAVTEGVLRDRCDALNRIFFHYIQNGTPYVTMKYAMTMDGRTATRAGHSKWITSSPARIRVHEDRNRHMAIMTGTGTVLADDPMLNCRVPGGRSPVRLICDTRLQTPLTARVVETAGEIPTWFLTCVSDVSLQAPYLEKGCRILEIPERKGHVDLQAAMEILGREGIDSIYLEGGSALNGSALESDIVQALHCYIAPRLFGGVASRGPIGGQGVEFPTQAKALQITSVRFYGDDILIESIRSRDGEDVNGCLQG